jgi:hypothetical protein
MRHFIHFLLSLIKCVTVHYDDDDDDDATGFELNFVLDYKDLQAIVVCQLVFVIFFVKNSLVWHQHQRDHHQKRYFILEHMLCVRTVGDD